MIFGYDRVSKKEQNLDRQNDMLLKNGVEKIFSEKFTGTVKNRPALDQLREMVRKDDTIIIESLSRLGRSSKDLLSLLEEFDSKGVKVISIKEKIDMSTATGKLLTTVLSALAQFERDTIVERTNEGLVAARKRGHIGGRPKLSEKTTEKALKMYDSKVYSIREICVISGISQGSLYAAIRNRKLNQ